MNEEVKVGYAPKPRGGLFRVQFRHPTEPGKSGPTRINLLVFQGKSQLPLKFGAFFDCRHCTKPWKIRKKEYALAVHGKYVEAATGVAVPKGWNKNKTPPPAWFAEAEKLIKAAYTTAPGDGPASQNRASWEEAERYFMEEIKRDGSERTYRSALGLVQNGLPGLHGPADVSPAHAQRFIRKVRGRALSPDEERVGALSTEDGRNRAHNLAEPFGHLDPTEEAATGCRERVGRHRAPAGAEEAAPYAL